jgi:branched-chain amino acid transport system substrate-binding protein
MKWMSKAIVALACAGACGVGNLAWAKKYDAGASDTEVKIGNTMPYSGSASSFSAAGKVIGAYFQKVNETGGVNGRKLVWLSYDDQYSPPMTVEQTRKLVEKDQVLAIMGSLGTATNSAVYRYLNQKKVPQLFLLTGAPKFSDPKAYPYTTPFTPSFEFEGRVFANKIKSSNPNAKVAVLYQNDDMGKAYLEGLKSGLGSGQIVAEASYESSDPTVDSQVVKLKSSGADVFVSFSMPRAAAQAIKKVKDINWNVAAQYVASSSAYVKTVMEPAGPEAAKGVMSTIYFKDASDPRWANDAATQEFKTFMKKYLPGEDVSNSQTVLGYTMAQVMVHVVTAAGDELTRENILKQATSIKSLSLPMLLPGITMQTTAANYQLFDAFQLIQFDGKQFGPVGAPVRP